MIRNDILECFILGYALEIPNDGRGRPMSITPLWLAAKERCGECEMDELLAALYNIQSDHAQIEKYVNVGSGWQVVGFVLHQSRQVCRERRRRSAPNSKPDGSTLGRGRKSICEIYSVCSGFAI